MSLVPAGTIRGMQLVCHYCGVSADGHNSSLSQAWPYESTHKICNLVSTKTINISHCHSSQCKVVKLD